MPTSRRKQPLDRCRRKKSFRGFLVRGSLSPQLPGRFPGIAGSCADQSPRYRRSARATAEINLTLFGLRLHIGASEAVATALNLLCLICRGYSAPKVTGPPTCAVNHSWGHFTGQKTTLNVNAFTYIA